MQPGSNGDQSPGKLERLFRLRVQGKASKLFYRLILSQCLKVKKRGRNALGNGLHVVNVFNHIQIHPGRDKASNAVWGMRRSDHFCPSVQVSVSPNVCEENGREENDGGQRKRAVQDQEALPRG